MANPLSDRINRAAWEGESFGIYASPGCLLFIEGWNGHGKRGVVQIDPGEEVDELIRYLHKAKRYARRSGSAPSPQSRTGGPTR